jgi:hypothetical protein
MNKNIFIFFTYIFLTQFTNQCVAQNQHKMIASFNKNVVKNGDTLNFDINLSDSLKSIKTASVHLWIEEITTGRKWHYKYPLLNGNLNASLKIDSSLKPGNYAFNFMMQRNFFRIKGKLKNPEKKDNMVNYVLLSKDKDIVTGVLPLDVDKSFISECMLFQDSAHIFFARPSHRGADLQIEFINDLDSSYTAVDSVMNFITIHDEKDSISTQSPVPTDYQFNKTDNLYKTIMPAVIVNSKSKKILDDYQKENVSGMFSGVDGTVIDGLTSDEIANVNNLLTFLTFKIAGLSIKNSEDGTEELVWRKRRTDIFINEIKVEPDLLQDIIPAEIAMIKIYEPGIPVAFGSAEGGTIAIYMKHGIYLKKNKPTNNFYINGYTGLNAIWK